MIRLEGQRRRPRQARPWKAAWRSWAALGGALAALWLGAAPGPSGPERTDLLALSGDAAAAISERGGFTICARARRPDCVIDGDTIRIGGVKIRLEDIDAPEVFSPKCPSERARGNRDRAPAGADQPGAVRAGPDRRPRSGPLRPQAADGRARRPLARRDPGRRRPGAALGRRPPQLVRLTIGTIRKLRARDPGPSLAGQAPCMCIRPKRSRACALSLTVALDGLRRTRPTGALKASQM